MFLDGGGTIVLPARGLVAGALAEVGIEVDPATVPRAHYRAVRLLDRAQAEAVEGAYADAFCMALGIAPELLTAATEAISVLADRDRSGRVLWSEPTPGAVETIRAFSRAGIVVIVVTNSDGHAAENLRDAGILAATGLSTAAVVDSVVVGSAKPDRGIFEAALDRAGVVAADAVHVGDMLTTDVVGARAAGIAAIHLDPYRGCRERHRHVRGLRGLWVHLDG